MEYDVGKLEELVKARDVTALRTFMTEHSLEVKNGYIVPSVKDKLTEQEIFWDQRQQTRRFCGTTE